MEKDPNEIWPEEVTVTFAKPFLKAPEVMHKLIMHDNTHAHNSRVRVNIYDVTKWSFTFQLVDTWGAEWGREYGKELKNVEAISWMACPAI